MKPEHFHYLLEINRCHSISSAARVLHLSQTTLSSIVKAAEATLGFTIFQRAPNGVITTPEGERLMVLAWEIDVKYEELLSLKHQAEGTTQPITVLLSPSVNVGLAIPLSKLFYQFELRGNLAFEEFPGLNIGPRIIQSAANIGVCYLSKAELAVFQKEAEKNRIILEPLLVDRFYLLVSRNHPFAQRQVVGIEELKDEQMAIVTSFRSNPSDPMWRGLSQGARQTVCFPSISIMRKAVLAQNMVGLLTGYSIYADGSMNHNLYCTIPLELEQSANRISIYLMRRGDRRLRYQEKILVSCIRDYFAALTIGAQPCGEEGRA